MDSGKHPTTICIDQQTNQWNENQTVNVHFHKQSLVDLYLQQLSTSYNIKTVYVAPYTTTKLPKNRISIKNSRLPEIFNQRNDCS